jgi:hypothetical protein
MSLRRRLEADTMVFWGLKSLGPGEGGRFGTRGVGVREQRVGAEGLGHGSNPHFLS